MKAIKEQEMAMQDKIKAFELFEKDWSKHISGEALQEHFKCLRQLNWLESENEALFNMDLTEISRFHLYLIKRVIHILNEEQSILNREYVRTHLILDQDMETTDEGASGDGILLFHEVSTHFIVGDIHSDDESLENALVKADFFKRVHRGESFKMIFMGDYVDRGHKHLKTIEQVLMLKVLFPKWIFLLRGNHDGGILKSDGEIQLPYGVPEGDDPKSYFPLYLKALITTNNTCDNVLLSSYLKCFDHLPYIAFIQKELGFIQCVHGGIPRPQKGCFEHLKTLSDLTQLKQESDSIIHNIMWSDPYRGSGDLRENMKRFYFTEKEYRSYQAHFGIWMLFRGHEVAEGGIRDHFGQTLFTVFSSGETCSTYYKSVSPKIVKLDVKGHYYFL